MSISPVPFFPVPPQQYNQQYMTEVVRAFSVFATQITNPAIAKPVLIEIPTSSVSGDEVGTVYETNTLLRIKSSTAANNTVGIPLHSRFAAYGRDRHFDIRFRWRCR